MKGTKKRYAARTIRPKVQRNLDYYLNVFKSVPLKKSSKGLPARGIDLEDIDIVLSKLDIDRSVGPVTNYYKGGTFEAKKKFTEFIAKIP